MREENFFKVSYNFYLAALSLNKMSVVEAFISRSKQKGKKDVALARRHTFVTTTGGGLLQNKSKQGGILFFENPPEIFHFYNLLLEISDKTKLNPMMDIPQNCVS